MATRSQRVEVGLAELERQHLGRTRRTVNAYAQPAGATRLIVEGRSVVNFCGNDYLALARHAEVAEALRESSLRWGVGSGASHLVTGHSAEHEALEEELAQFVGRERALLFSTGYMANLAAVTTLVGPGDLVVLDRLSHASLIDAALLSRARFARFAHGDADAAERLLARRRGRPDGRERRALIATDGVFSMDGDLAPVAALADAAETHDAWLLVDDAHGLGVLGPEGRGTLDELHLPPAAVPLLVGTLGKAFGTFGAFLAGSRELIELALQRARPYIYTTALPPAVAAATRTALRVAQREPWRRERVRALTQRFRNAAQRLGIGLGASSTPIQPVVIGTAQAAVAASLALLEEGFWVAAIRPPTVPQGSSRLRVTLCADHTEAQVDELADALGRTLTQICTAEIGA